VVDFWSYTRLSQAQLLSRRQPFPIPEERLICLIPFSGGNMAGFAGLTFLVLYLPFQGAWIAPVLARMFGHSAAWLLALAPALAFVHFATLVPAIAGGGTVVDVFDRVPSLNLRFSLLLDGLSFFILTAPISAHLLARSAYKAGYSLSSQSARDDLNEK
jgi:multisubunit Na+/H+ antiporter MnhG subunit